MYLKVYKYLNILLFLWIFSKKLNFNNKKHGNSKILLMK
jgi:hypothetical protein